MKPQDLVEGKDYIVNGRIAKYKVRPHWSALGMHVFAPQDGKPMMLLLTDEDLKNVKEYSQQEGNL